MKRDERINEITSQLEQGVQDLYDSENYKSFLDVMGKFHNYSFNNCMLIHLQMPSATHVAGYKAWQKKFNRQVRKGERAIHILAPVPHEKIIEKEENGETVFEWIKWVTFRPCSVFDISQTDGDELPSICNDLNGEIEGYDELIGKLEKLAPVGVKFEEIKGGAKGYYNTMTNEIVIQRDMSESQTLKTLIHELAHSVLHKEGGEGSDDPLNSKEVQAESVAYVVCSYLGIDTSDYSFGYIAGWSKGQELDELKTSMENIRKTAAGLINGLAA